MDASCSNFSFNDANDAESNFDDDEDDVDDDTVGGRDWFCFGSPPVSLIFAVVVVAEDGGVIEIENGLGANNDDDDDVDDDDESCSWLVLDADAEDSCAKDVAVVVDFAE